MNVPTSYEPSKTAPQIETAPGAPTRPYRYNVRAWVTEDSPMSLRLRVATSESTGFNEWFDEIERAHKRCEALLEAGYFCWVYDTQEDLNVSPYLAVPIPMRGKTH